MASLLKKYIAGTHRSVAPTDTLARIQPLLPAAGITRCANVTGLDRIGIPVYCAIRPGGQFIQVTNGKGLCPIEANVSSLMEAIEFFHCEQPTDTFWRTSFEKIKRTSMRAIHPKQLPAYREDRFFSDSFMIDWIQGEDLIRKEPV